MCVYNIQYIYIQKRSLDLQTDVFISVPLIGTVFFAVFSIVSNLNRIMLAITFRERLANRGKASRQVSKRTHCLL